MTGEHSGLGAGGMIPAFLSIAMPVYNEEQTIRETVQACVEKVAGRFERFEIIVADDASRDGTAQALRDLRQRIPELRVLRSDRNLGHGATLQRALNTVEGSWVFVIDSDYQHDPGDFWRLFQLAGERTIVMGWREERVDALYRHVASVSGNYFIRAFCGMRIRDINIPFKLFPGPVLKNLLATLPPRALVPSTLLIVGAGLSGMAIRQVPVAHLPRRHGASTLPGLRFAFFAIRAAVELLRYRVEFKS